MGATQSLKVGVQNFFDKWKKAPKKKKKDKLTQHYEDNNVGSVDKIKK